MNYIELVNNFWKKDIEYNFSDKEIALFFYLLSISNSIAWKNPFGLSNAMTIAKFGWGKKSFDTAKNNLQKADLISFRAGDGRGNVYQYTIKVVEKVGQKNTLCNDTLKDCKKGTQKTSLLGSLSDTHLDTLLEQKGETSINIDINKVKLVEIEKKQELVFPFTSNLFFEKWNLLISAPKWKVKAVPSLQIALDGLKKFDEDFVIEILNEAIVGDWGVFKGVELSEQYTRWEKQNKKPEKPAKEIKSRFVPPTLEDIFEYFTKEKGLTLIDSQYRAERFYNFYSGKNWMVGKNKMSLWRSSATQSLEWEDKRTDKKQSVQISQTTKDVQKVQSKHDESKQLAEEIKGNVYSRLKSENPEMEQIEFVKLYFETWVHEYKTECVNRGLEAIN